MWYLQLHGTVTQRAFVAGNLSPRGHYLEVSGVGFLELKELPWLA